MSRTTLRRYSRSSRKRPCGDHLFEVGVGGRDHADVHLDRVRLAKRLNLVVVEEPEQLRLDFEVLSDLVQEERAAGRRADHAGERRVGAGEGAPAVAEQLALEHVSRHRAAVEGLERTIGAIGRAVDHARQHLLARTGFPGEENRHRIRSDAPGDRQQLCALFGGPDALGVSVEGLGRPEGGALLFVPSVLVEAASGGDQLADGRDGAVVFQVRERPRQDLPRFVSVLTKDGKVLGRSLPDGVERLSLAPALGRITLAPVAPTATRASCSQHAASSRIANASRPRMWGCPADSISATALSRLGGAGS